MSYVKKSLHIFIVACKIATEILGLLLNLIDVDVQKLNMKYVRGIKSVIFNQRAVES